MHESIGTKGRERPLLARKISISACGWWIPAVSHHGRRISKLGDRWELSDECEFRELSGNCDINCNSCKLGVKSIFSVSTPIVSDFYCAAVILQKEIDNKRGLEDFEARSVCNLYRFIILFYFIEITLLYYFILLKLLYHVVSFYWNYFIILFYFVLVHFIVRYFWYLFIYFFFFFTM